jgi:hydrogenase/urease accessory protein HupE
MMNSPFAFSLFFAALAVLLPSPTWAHLVNTGMGPVYDGIGHLLLTPEDLVPVLALSCYCGLRGPQAGRWAMFMLPVAWCAGGFVGLGLDLEISLPFTALSFLLLGGLVAADARLPMPAVAPLIAVVGLVHGVLNGLILKTGPGGPAILGIMGALFVLVALLSAVVVSLERSWLKIAVRVAGSWVAACGLLMIALHFSGQLS